MAVVNCSSVARSTVVWLCGSLAIFPFNLRFREGRVGMLELKAINTQIKFYFQRYINEKWNSMQWLGFLLAWGEFTQDCFCYSFNLSIVALLICWIFSFFCNWLLNLGQLWSFSLFSMSELLINFSTALFCQSGGVVIVTGEGSRSCGCANQPIRALQPFCQNFVQTLKFIKTELDEDAFFCW